METQLSRQSARQQQHRPLRQPPEYHGKILMMAACTESLHQCLDATGRA
jgi:hypothetical protein